MKAVILQSNYIPWKGYFDLIHDADVFIFYDDVQYTKNDWRNRNKIYTPNGLQWLTIPIAGDAVKKKISEVELKDSKWQQLHYRSLSLGYARAPFYSQLKPLLEKIYLSRNWERLIDINHFQIEYISSLIGISTLFKRSSDYTIEGDRVQKLINLLKQAGADTYISGPAAKNYLAGYEDTFSENNIKLVYKDYSGYPEYPQLSTPFEHGVSILDMIANIEINQIKEYIWGWRA